jgi:hypothetical protein
MEYATNPFEVRVGRESMETLRMADDDSFENNIKEIFPKKQFIPEVIYKKSIRPPPTKVPHEKIDLRNSKIDVKLPV